MKTRYPTLMIIIHWLVAVLVLAAYITGGNPVKHQFEGQIHVATGMAIMVLFLIRLPIRLFFRKSIPDFNLPTWQTHLASTVQWALYLCMILIPFLGMLALAEKTDQYLLFGFNIPMITTDLGIEFDDIHEALAQLFIGLAGIHAVAALLHHFVWKDGVLKSMLLRK
ncbi:hypothetical protein A1D22_01690 [Pasteurellaceae bacterium LFhippo2]|nr:hypothetical protein [Pasteurellaceae bacterium LFhippo2]